MKVSPLTPPLIAEPKARTVLRRLEKNLSKVQSIVDADGITAPLPPVAKVVSEAMSRKRAHAERKLTKTKQQIRAELKRARQRLEQKITIERRKELKARQAEHDQLLAERAELLAQLREAFGAEAVYSVNGEPTRIWRDAQGKLYLRRLGPRSVLAKAASP